jgi:AcrR family transcriptional regulator
MNVLITAGILRIQLRIFECLELHGAACRDLYSAARDRSFTISNGWVSWFTYQDPGAIVQDRRQSILSASLAILREKGYVGFTQPRVAAAAGLRQSHLTYYFPTRTDLLMGVARVAIDRQLAAVDGILKVSSVRKAATTIANVAVRHENTRVIMALAQAADQEPALRELFRELADGIILRAGKLLINLNIEPTDERCYQLHSMSVGMAVIDLAEERGAGAARTLEAALTSMKEGATR